MFVYTLKMFFFMWRVPFLCKSLETFVDVQCAMVCLKTCSDDRPQKSQFSCHQNFAAFSCLPVMTFVISKDLSFVDPPITHISSLML